MRIPLALAFLSISSSTLAASFDCSKASTLVEQSICSNKELSDLDDSLAAAYTKATAAGNPDAVRNRQREWLRNERNKCQDIACVRTAYTKRIAELATPASGRDARAAAISIDCADTQRMTSAHHAMCEVPEFRQLGQDIDELTKRLEQSLSEANREALLDTEKPFVVERNGCQNERPEVGQCVERVLRQRHAALNAAVTTPDSMRGVVALYKYLNPAFVLKYGESLLGRRVNVFGCLTLDAGRVTAERLKGNIRESCSEGSQVPVFFQTMDQVEANFIDDKRPSSHFGVTVQSDNGRIVLRME